MARNGREHIENTEVIQRYCPQREENVAMIRTLGLEKKLRCISYDTCPMRTEGICGEKIKQK